jgi:hypothetical protein
LLATLGPGQHGFLGSTRYEVLEDPDVLVEIADWESAEARDAHMQEAAVTGAYAPLLELLAARSEPWRASRGYVTNIANPTPELVIGAYQRLFQIEKSFRMAKTDLAARPIFHRTRDSIEAHLTIVFAALAISRWIEDTTGWSIKKFVKTLRRYRTIQIQAGTSGATPGAAKDGESTATLSPGAALGGKASGGCMRTVNRGGHAKVTLCHTVAGAARTEQSRPPGRGWHPDQWRLCVNAAGQPAMNLEKCAEPRRRSHQGNSHAALGAGLAGRR